MKRTDITGLFPEATDEQVKTLMDINGADINNAKKDYETLQQRLDDAAAKLAEAKNGADALKAAQDEAASYKTELDSMKQAEATRLMREKVASEAGIPVKLLTSDNEEECVAQAKAISEFANKYPSVPDGGEVTPTQKKTTRDQFADWFNGKLE